jgi:hypothetical protein
MDSLNKTRAYMIIYKFASISQWNNSINQIDGWLLSCPITKNRNFLNKILYFQYL